MPDKRPIRPNPMKDYILFSEDGNGYIGRWLAGSIYEGWYIRDIDDPEGPARIVSQKELNIQYFYDQVRGVKYKYTSLGGNNG